MCVVRALFNPHPSSDAAAETAAAAAKTGAAVTAAAAVQNPRTNSIVVLFPRDKRQKSIKNKKGTQQQLNTQHQELLCVPPLVARPQTKKHIYTQAYTHTHTDNKS